MRLVLASASPRRRELLRQICPEFDVVPSEIDETLDGGPTVEAVARLALRKARAGAAHPPSAIVLAAHTVAGIDGVALGQPARGQAARAKPVRFAGRGHEV